MAGPDVVIELVTFETVDLVTDQVIEISLSEAEQGPPGPTGVGQEGPPGPPGPEGPKGEDGQAQIPAYLDGGNF